MLIDIIVFCFSVSVLGDFNYTAADFGRADVYNTIRDYLTLGQSVKPHDVTCVLVYVVLRADTILVFSLILISKKNLYIAQKHV